MRIGLGFDVHRLVEGRKLILGGVEIVHEKGLLGHSDADVLVHAVIDAFLGAAKLGDIGRLFPDDDPAFKDADSLDLLKKCYQLVQEKGLEMINLDVVVMAQNPKLKPYIEQMESNLAQILETDHQNLNIKATTTEKLGFVGREEGMAAEAVVLLKKKGA